MEEHICKCVNCGKLLKENDRVFQVTLIEVSHGLERIINPTCSIHCARERQRRNAEWLENCLRDVRNQSFQNVTVHQYYGDWSEHAE